ncbi:ribosome small subunit-dependent GTPase A [Bordetella petrii]|uniref:Small ribosomal subunit biogenesis GTPase RsgA n=1 Tax=Bordetella petrii TaxID=94624 RepID=A0ABT7VYV6_9BORD|nr:ribosome small subunit-dependent GTPase A [Bordetella petrii]MDM9558121.1 ribosome small subunit-dependent GTPase A [Bordetella petrii]
MSATPGRPKPIRSRHERGADAAAATQAEGRIIAAHGRHYVVEFPDGAQRHCFPRGKKAGAAVGDRVLVAPQGRDEGVIEAILPRRNLLYRSDEMRAKQFAANVDQLLIVVAVEPTFSDDLAGRALAGAWSAGIEPLIILNKTDLRHGLDAARARLASVRALGVPVIELSAHDSAAVHALLAPRLAGRTTLLLGQSGMGKSTLLNTLAPQAGAATREYSAALDMGRHTTTTTRLYHLPPPGGDLIDSPGFQAFGLQHLSGADILRGFPEFAPHIEHCRFYNCTHRHEPGCGVVAALQAGGIDPGRYALYRRILEESEAAQQRY